MSIRFATAPRWATSLSLAGLVLVAGCQSDSTRVDDASTRIENALETAARSQPATTAPATPAAVSAALLPPLTARPVRVARKPEPRFTVSVRDAPARQFFMSLVEGTPHNMVVHPGVEGAITLELKEVTIPDVMDIVRNVYGYEFERSAHGFEVLPRRLRSRIYQVNYLNMRRSGASQTRVSSGQVTQTSGGASSNDGTTTTRSERAAATTGTEINTVQPETSFWSELETSVLAILGDAEGRSVVVNPQSGVVVVRALPNELREVEAFLVAAQAIARRQVILEAKVLEVRLDDEFRQGINWATMFQPAANKSVTVGQVGGSSIFGNGTSLNAGSVGNLDPSGFLPIAGAVAGGFGGMFTLALALNDFNAFIELLDTQGTVHVLSSPRIATMNNQKAVIKVGSDEFFVTDISSTTTTGTTTTTTPSVELTPFFSGIALDVTPQISEAGDVILHVHPAVSEVVDQQKTFVIGDVEQTLPLAYSTVRESDSIVQARSGQVVVIGGLMQDLVRNDRSDTPLSSAPGIGDLFSHKAQSYSKSELVILLKPIVVNAGNQWAAVMRDSADRVRGIRGETTRTVTN